MKNKTSTLLMIIFVIVALIFIVITIACKRDWYTVVTNSNGDGVPHVEQKELGYCGPACGNMFLFNQDYDMRDQESFFEMMDSNGDGNISMYEIAECLDNIITGETVFSWKFWNWSDARSYLSNSIGTGDGVIGYAGGNHAIFFVGTRHDKDSDTVKAFLYQDPEKLGYSTIAAYAVEAWLIEVNELLKPAYWIVGIPFTPYINSRLIPDDCQNFVESHIGDYPSFVTCLTYCSGDRRLNRESPKDPFEYPNIDGCSSGSGDPNIDAELIATANGFLAEATANQLVESGGPYKYLYSDCYAEGAEPTEVELVYGGIGRLDDVDIWAGIVYYTSPVNGEVRLVVKEYLPLGLSSPDSVIWATTTYLPIPNSYYLNKTSSGRKVFLPSEVRNKYNGAVVRPILEWNSEALAGISMPHWIVEYRDGRRIFLSPWCDVMNLDEYGMLRFIGNKTEENISGFRLSQNYPNPFNLSTKIEYSLPKDGYVHLTIYNVLGQKVKTLVDDEMNAGTHTITWDGTNEYGQVVSSGIYFYRLVAGENMVTKKMILMK